MNIRKIIMSFLVPVVLIGLTGCNEKVDEPNPQIGTYQEYFVLVTPTMKAGYANLRENDSNGKLLHYRGNETLLLNSRQMYYQEVTANNLYNYSNTIEENHDVAIFKFTPKGKKTLVNQIQFDLLPDLEIPNSLLEIEPGFDIGVDIPADPGVEVKSYLIENAGGLNPKSYDATVNRISGEIIFNNVPSGTYDLIIDIQTSVPTLQNDRSAGGRITLLKRQTRRNVKMGAL